MKCLKTPLNTFLFFAYLYLKEDTKDTLKTKKKWIVYICISQSSKKCGRDIFSNHDDVRAILQSLLTECF